MKIVPQAGGSEDILATRRIFFPRGSRTVKTMRQDATSETSNKDRQTPAVGQGRTFDASEFARRLRRTRQRMAERGLDALMTTNAANMHYLTGYDGWSFYVKQGVVVTPEETSEPFWFGRAMDRNGALLTTWLNPENVYGYEDEYLEMLGGDPMAFLTERLKERGLDRCVLGVEMDNYWFSASDYLRLTRDLPHVELVDATNLVNWVRAVKSPREIQYMREAGRIVERVMHTAIDCIKPGDHERYAAARVLEAQIEGTEAFGGDFPAIMPLMPASRRASAAHLTFSSDRRYQRGDVVLLELAGCRHHYHAPLSRTVYLDDAGKVPKRLRQIADAVLHGLGRTLDYIAPGRTAAEIAKYWHESLSGSGVSKPSRLGYAYGMNYVPDWGEHTVSLHASDHTVLEPGMTLHVMPGIWEDELGFECSEPILITEEGCERFVEFPQKLFTL